MMDCSAGRERNNHDDPVDRCHSRDESNHDRSLNHRCSSSSQNNKETNNNEKGTNNSSVNISANNSNNNSSNSITKRRIKPPKCIRKTSFFSKERFCFVKIRNNHDSRFQQEKQQKQKNGSSTCISVSIPLLLLWPGLMINDLQKCLDLAENNNDEEEEESLLSTINTIRRNNNSNVRINDTNEDDDANRRLFQDCVSIEYLLNLRVCFT
jgi:hypothetical protein